MYEIICKPALRVGLGYGLRSASVGQEFQPKTRLVQATFDMVDRSEKQNDSKNYLKLELKFLVRRLETYPRNLTSRANSLANGLDILSC